jgi:hypothetical protein
MASLTSIRIPRVIVGGGLAVFTYSAHWNQLTVWYVANTAVQVRW